MFGACTVELSSSYSHGPRCMLIHFGLGSYKQLSRCKKDNTRTVTSIHATASSVSLQEDIRQPNEPIPSLTTTGYQWPPEETRMKNIKSGQRQLDGPIKHSL